MTASEKAPGATPHDLTSVLTRYAALLRSELTPLLHGSDGLHSFYGMIHYHLGWVDRDFAPLAARSGKSLRPALCLLMAEGLGAQAEDCTALAAGIELLHDFSLVHDDIQDRSAVRRGRPAVWVEWGEAQAINLGDGIFALAHLAWLRSPLARRDPAAFVEILESLERTILALCEGQFLDIEGESSLDMSAAGYLTMIGRKTAALIAEAAWVGARAATSDPSTLDAARTFGYQLGVAFQIRDDVLGIWGEESRTGKSAFTDIASRKMTLPVVLALEHGDARTRAALRARYGKPPENGEGDAPEVRALLETAGADQMAAEQEEEHWRAAMASLDLLPLSSTWYESLAAFARMFVARSA